MGVSIVMGDPQNRWFIREIPTKMDDDLGGPISGNLHIGDVSLYALILYMYILYIYI